MHCCFSASACLRVVATELHVLPDDAPQLSAIVLTGYLLYCALLESSRWQATLGKTRLGLKVTELRGERIGFGRAVVRFVARLLSVLTLCLGYLLIVVTKRRQGVARLIAGTVVAYDGSPRRPAWLVAGVSAGALVPFLAVLAAVALPAYQRLRDPRAGHRRPRRSRASIARRSKRSGATRRAGSRT